MTATGAGAMTAQHTQAGSTIVDDGRAMACLPGDVITARGFSRAATAARSVNVGVIFTDDNGAAVGSTIRGSNVTNSTANFTTQPTASATCPVGASWAVITPQVLAAAGAGEIHYWDDFYLDRGSVSSSNDPGNWAVSSVTAVTGQFSALWQRVLGDSPVYVRTLPAPIDITGRTKFSFWLGLATTTSAYKNWHKGPMQLRVTLTDTGGDTITFGAKNVTVQASSLQKKPHWQFLSAHITQGVPNFDYANVAAYSIQCWNAWNGYLIQPVLQASAYLCNVRATAGSDGSTWRAGGVVHTARAGGLRPRPAGCPGHARAVRVFPRSPSSPRPAWSTSRSRPGSAPWTNRNASPPALAGRAGCWSVTGGGGSGGGEYAMDPKTAVTPLEVLHGVAGACGRTAMAGRLGATTRSMAGTPGSLPIRSPPTPMAGTAAGGRMGCGAAGKAAPVERLPA